MPWIHTHSFGPCLPVFQKRVRKSQTTNMFLVVQNRLVMPCPYNTEEENPRGRGRGAPCPSLHTGHGPCQEGAHSQRLAKGRNRLPDQGTGARTP